MSVVPVILSGGSGNRLWPLSREWYPKQLLSLLGDHSLLQQAALRAQAVSADNPIIIANQDYRFMVRNQLQAIGLTEIDIILEPCGRNTAPAAAIAALAAMARDSEALVLLMPADHIIMQADAFVQAVSQAAAVASAGYLVTFGVPPQEPHTGYGYIKRGEAIQGGYKVSDFTEKPDRVRAEQYVIRPDYYWNSGIFLFKARDFLQELRTLAPNIARVCEQAFAAKTQDLFFTQLPADIFTTCPNDSIDYAVMEKTQHAAVVPLDGVAWHDVGSWSALWDVIEQDDRGNVLQGDVLAVDVQNSYIHSSERLVAALGVSNQVIVETKDAILVVDKSRCQEVKRIVSQLKQAKRAEVQHHQKVYRPWGYYETLASGNAFQVKRLLVYPGAALSLQLHHHRSEHWVVVSGIAHVVCGEQLLTLEANQSTYIPVGTKHRLSNQQTMPLEVIEVQSGDYLGEDDIIRFEDQYARMSLAKEKEVL